MNGRTWDFFPVIVERGPTRRFRFDCGTLVAADLPVAEAECQPIDNRELSSSADSESGTDLVRPT